MRVCVRVVGASLGEEGEGEAVVAAAAMRLAHRLAYPLRTQIDGVARVSRAHGWMSARTERRRGRGREVRGVRWAGVGGGGWEGGRDGEGR